MIKSLISLRGIFILFIFFHHCLHLYPGGGTMAVAFFFVLGGFSMTLGYRDRILNSDFNYKQYLTRRCIKFYPLHWLCILAILPITLLSLRIQQIPIFLANAVLAQTWIPIEKVYFSLNRVSWYLADTMFFALMFPMLCKLIFRSNKWERLFFCLMIASIYMILAILLPQKLHHAILYISPYVRLTDFILGIILARFYQELKDNHKSLNVNTIISQIIIIVLIILIVLESCLLPEDLTWFAPVYWPLVSLIVIVASLTEGGKLLENGFLLSLGELSFIIFMIHQIVLRYTTIVFNKILHYENNIIYVLFTLVFTIVLSAIVDKYILKPITQWLTRRSQQSMTARS